MGWHRSRGGRDTEGGAAIICLQYSSLLTHFSTLWQQQLTFWRWSEFIKRWRAVGSRCICDTVGSQVVPGRKRPHYMECNAQSLLLLWSQSTLNHVPGHIYVWQRLTDFQQVGGNLCEKKVQNQDRCFPQGLRHLRADLVVFLTIDHFCFLWFAVTWKTPEGNASGYPSLCCGEENQTKDTLSHFIFFIFICSELLHVHLLISPK